MSRRESTDTAVCSLCGGNFECGAYSGKPCWCFSLPNVMAPDASQSCWCPACLKSQIEEKLAGTAE